MSQHAPVSYRDDLYEGPVSAGPPVGAPLHPPTADEIRWLEQAWNNPRAYELSRDEGFAGVGRASKRELGRRLLPTREEISSLPRRAQVAYAARCARRVLPLVCSWREVFARAVRVAEEARTETQMQAEAVASSARAWVRDWADSAAAVAAEAAIAYAAARAREQAAPDDPFRDDYAEVATNAVAHAVTVAVQRLFSIVTTDTLGYLAAPAHDFERLVRLAVQENWTDETPVPPSVFGPMWDGPPPEWWTED